MTFEARLGFLAFFFLLWAIAGLLPWAVAAIANRGRGAEWALPVTVASSWAAGVLVPALGLRDLTGLMISVCTASAGGAAGAFGTIAVWRRLDAQRAAEAGDGAVGDAPVRAPTLDRPPPPSLD